MSLTISGSDYDEKNKANSRGQISNSNLQAHIAGFWQISDDWNLSFGGSIYQDNGLQEETNFIPHNSYLSYTHDYFQVDLGYKELWLSPLQESAMLISTNAEPIARFSISSPTPLTDWNIQYGLSFGKLKKMEGIRFAETVSSGRPGFLTMNLSAQPFDWWTLGVNRTMVFGGGERETSLSDVWSAIIDPVSGDNCGGASSLQDCDKEAGNQQASISSKIDIAGELPMSIYMELAGEDTNDFKPYSLGNKAYNLGFFFPYLTDRSSLLFEYQHIENAWYVHHLYQEGYRNDLHSIGHWWGDEKLVSDGIGARILTMRYNLEFSNSYHLDVKISSLKNVNLGHESVSNESIYKTGTELTLGLNNVSTANHLRYELNFGRDVMGEDFTRLSLSYRWQ